MRTYTQSFDASFDYPVVFTEGVFAPKNPALVEAISRKGEDRSHRFLAFIDEGVDAAHPGLREDLAHYAEAHADRLEQVMPARVVCGGEAIKNDYRLVMEIVDTILECRLCRHSCVIALGGGAVLDAVGFAVSIVHRGLRLVRLPTTVLAQGDGGVGVKTGMNLHGGKNTIGTFAPPFAVINDLALLRTLSDEHWRSGIAEAFKVAVIKDREFLEYLCAHAKRLRDRDEEAMGHLVRRCAELHLEHIRAGGDPFETGEARPLDFGHWSAHRLESMSGYRIAHGSAVAVGVALDTWYAMRKGWVTEQEAEAVLCGLRDAGLPLGYDVMERRLGDGTLEILCGLDDFREHLGGRLTLAYPDGIGAVREEHEVDTALVEEGLLVLLDRHRASLGV